MSQASGLHQLNQEVEGGFREPLQLRCRLKRPRNSVSCQVFTHSQSPRLWSIQSVGKLALVLKKKPSLVKIKKKRQKRCHSALSAPICLTSITHSTSRLWLSISKRFNSLLSRWTSGCLAVSSQRPHISHISADDRGVFCPRRLRRHFPSRFLPHLQGQFWWEEKRRV